MRARGTRAAMPRNGRTVYGCSRCCQKARKRWGTGALGGGHGDEPEYDYGGDDNDVMV